MSGAPAAAAAASPGSGWTTTRRRAAALVGWYLLTRLVCLLAVAAAGAAAGVPFGELLTVFDGAYYRDIATDGYPARLPAGPGGVGMSSIAFFPLYPALLALPVAAGLPFALVATAVNVACGAAATVLVHEVVGHYAPPRVALGVAVLWPVQPLGFVLSLAYSEALYSALALGCLLLLLRRRWWAAGAVAALASATRPTGLVLACCAALALLHAWRHRADDRWRALAAPALAPVGFGAYMAYLAVRTGRPDAWFATEREGWGVYTDGGVATAGRFATYLLDPTRRPAATGVSVVLVVLVVLVAAVLREGAPLPVLAFLLVTVLLAVTTRNAYSSIPRFVLPALFVALVPLVRLLVRRGGGPAGVLLPGVAVLALLATAAAGAYVTTASTFPP